MRAVALVLVATWLAGPALAASADAWAQSMRDAKAACRKASDLRNAASLGEPAVFSDTSGNTAVLVTGIWRPARMKGARASMLCLYDRAGRTAEIQEAKRWTAPKN